MEESAWIFADDFWATSRVQLARCIDDQVVRVTRKPYLKFEDRIPMRDGVTKFTQVYLPKDRTKRYLFLIQRTPFGVAPYGEGKSSLI